MNKIEVINEIKRLMGKSFTKEREESLTKQLDKHSDCENFVVDNSHYGKNNCIVSFEECDEGIWDDDFHNRNTSIKVLEKFEEMLKTNLNDEICEEDKKLIFERLGEHKECVDNGYVLPISYGENNISLECESCNEVIVDSDTISE